MSAPAQPPPLPPGPPKPRAWVDIDRLTQPRREERVAMGAAVLLTLLLHGGLFFWVIPWLGNLELAAAKNARMAAEANPPPAAPAVVYELQPATPEDQKAIRYVEVNPNAPDSKPIATKNISNRDQISAQPIPDLNSHSDLPATDGTLADSPKIVSGDLRKPTPPPSSAPSPEATLALAAPPPTAPPPSQIAMSTVTLPGNITKPAGEGVMISDRPVNLTPTKPAPENLPQDTTAQNDYQLPPGPLTPQSVAASADAATPQARPTAPIKTQNGPLANNPHGSRNPAPEPQVDAAWSPFGTYLQMMFEAIGAEWYNECDAYRFDVRDEGAKVVVAFVINKQGEVESAQVEDSSATAGATSLCVNAVKRPAPYGVWTPDMVALLGDQHLIKVTFYYQ